MAFATRTYITGELIDAVDMNTLRDNLLLLGTHGHGSGLGSGNGTAEIGPIGAITIIPASGVTVPPAGLTALFISEAVSSGVSAWRQPGSSIFLFSNATHTHAAL